jgi:hypothetical protein
MRACARAALVLVVLSASFGLAGCAAIEEIRDAFLRWVESEKLPSEGEVIVDEFPEATPVIPPEKPKETKKQVKSARKLQRPQTVELPPLPPLPPSKPPIPDSAEAATPPEDTGGRSAPSQPVPRQLPSRYPEAPPPGRFSR